MKPAVLVLSLLAVLGSLPQPAVAQPGQANAVQAGEARTPSVRISSIKPHSFSVLDGTLRGTVSGQLSGSVNVNLFAYDAKGAPHRVSPATIRPGRFTFALQGDLNAIMSGGAARFFVSPSDDGSQDPSPVFQLSPEIVLPAPTVVSAVNGPQATVSGAALRGARIHVTLAGTTKEVVADGQTGDWRATFDPMPDGRHTVSAKVVDGSGTFPDSTETTARLVAEGDITRPLRIGSPSPGAKVSRMVHVTGHASPGRGNVQVSIAGGPIVEANVNPTEHQWYARPTSPTQGISPLVVWLPGTGEMIRTEVDVAPFGDIATSRFTRSYDPGKNPAMVAEGTINLDGQDTEVSYSSRDNGWSLLSPVDEEGRWRYEGELPRDMYLSARRIDGVIYSRVATLKVASNIEGVEVPLLWDAPELTSPLRVGPNATLSGIVHIAPRNSEVKISLADGRSFNARSDDDRHWSVDVGPLPLGRSVVQLSTVVPASMAADFATSSYVLDVVESP